MGCAGEERDRSIEAQWKDTRISPVFRFRHVSNSKRCLRGTYGMKRPVGVLGEYPYFKGTLCVISARIKSALYLSFDEQMQPEVGRYIGWNELQTAGNNLISKSARFSPTFLMRCWKRWGGISSFFPGRFLCALPRILPFQPRFILSSWSIWKGF